MIRKARGIFAVTAGLVSTLRPKDLAARHHVLPEWLTCATPCATTLRRASARVGALGVTPGEERRPPTLLRPSTMSFW